MFAVPASAVWLGHGASGSAILLLIVSLCGLVLLRNESVVLNRNENILLSLFMLFFLYSFFSWWLHGMEDSGLKQIGKHFSFIFFIPIYYWLRRIRPRADYLYYGVVAGSFFSFLSAIFSDQTFGFGRAHGALHPILFGNIALILGFMSFAMKDIINSKVMILRLIPVAALILGVMASVMSGSRGGWVAIPSLVVVLLASRWGVFSARSKVIVLLLVFVFPVIAYLVPATGIGSRMDEAVSDIDTYIKADEVVHTSLGIRLESWKAAYFMVIDNPLLGVGLGRFQEEASILIGEGVVHQGADQFNHSHNDYLSQLAVNGLIGLFLLILMFVYPLKQFYNNFFSTDDEIKALAVAGACLIVAFMQYSLSETLMIRSTSISIYGTFVIVLLALINNKKQSQVRS